jgi:hypothetical protein
MLKRYSMPSFDRDFSLTSNGTRAIIIYYSGSKGVYVTGTSTTGTSTDKGGDRLESCPLSSSSLLKREAL